MIHLSDDEYLDLLCLKNGLYDPLDRFMCEDEFKNVLMDFRLLNKSVFTMPIFLKADSNFKLGQIKSLIYKGKKIASIKITSVYKITKEQICELYVCKNETHPGIKKEFEKGFWRCGGELVSFEQILLENFLYKNCIKEEFQKLDKDIQTICGFQTRNAIHKAHEHLQRTALEFCDALFINPLTGYKKSGDFTNEAVFKAYETMLLKFYPKKRVLLKPLQTAMRYAGPKEAIFHAIIRRNLGCTHFIIGRDHAGVGDFYEKYAAQDFAKHFKDDLGIHILALKEPYYCKVCEQITSEKSCSHTEKDKIYISATNIRKSLLSKEIPSEKIIRKEISSELLKLENIFI